MIPGPLLAIAILAGAALGLVVWKALAPKPVNGQVLFRPTIIEKQDLAKGAAFALTLAALGLAFGAWSWVTTATPAPWLPTLLTDDLARLLGALFLGLVGLSWLGDGAERGTAEGAEDVILSAVKNLCFVPPSPPSPAQSDSFPDARERCALFLLAVCGGLIAISAADLLILWIGLELYTLSRAFIGLHSPRPGLEEGLGVRAVLGMAASLLGLAFLYASAGTLEISPLGHYLWEHGGPRPAMLYAGAGLTLGGIALVAGLLPPYGPEASESEAPATALGIALLARLCLYPLGALVWEWSWGFIPCRF